MGKALPFPCCKHESRENQFKGVSTLRHRVLEMNPKQFEGWVNEFYKATKFSSSNRYSLWAGYYSFLGFGAKGLSS